MTEDSLIRDLNILGISDTPVKDLTVHNVKIAFFKLALVKHPDKAGGSSAAFQELLKSYQNILKHLAENLNNDDLDNDEQFLKDLFKEFNFPRENDQSFTILIENELADTWEEEISELYNDPTINAASNGHQWKTMFEFAGNVVKISMTLWKSPKSNNQSKILIQGGKQSLNTIFVFNELPKIYQKVKDRRTQKPSFISITQDLSCKKCETHITTIHTNKSPQNRDTVEVVDRTNLETHITTYHTDKPPEKPDTEEVVDVFHCFQCNATFDDRNNLGEHNEIKHKATCVICEKGFENDEFLRIHKANDHDRLECDGCEFTVLEETELRKHIIENHSHLNYDLKHCNECDQNVKVNDLKLQCDHCEFFYHKKCTEFKSKSCQWNEPEKWLCKFCSGNTIDSTLNPKASMFISSQPPFSGKHRKSKVNTENPDVEFLQATINSLKGTLAKNELEMKKLKESNELKIKRISNLEAQVEDAKNIFAKNKCDNFPSEEVSTPQIVTSNLDGCHQMKLVSLEGRTTNLEQNLTLLMTKLEHFQLNSQSLNKTSGNLIISPPEPHSIYICEICEEEFPTKLSLKKHKESIHENKEPKTPKQSIHTQSYAYLKCKQCSYVAVHMKDLTRHINQMHEEVFMCTRCDFSTQYDGRLKEHVKLVHEQSSRYFYSSDRNYKKQQNTRQPNAYQESFSNEPIKCNSCEYETTSIPELRKHKAEHIKQQGPKHPFSNQMYASNQQNFTGYNKSKEINKEDYNCDDCEMYFEEKDKFGLHMEFFHANTASNSSKSD